MVPTRKAEEMEPAGTPGLPRDHQQHIRLDIYQRSPDMVLMGD